MKDHVFELRRIIIAAIQLYYSRGEIRSHDLCDTGAVLYQLSYQANWELITM